MALRILVTGSRDWPDPTAVWAALELAIVQSAATEVVVVHGGAKGADQHAGLFVKAHRRQFAAQGTTLIEEVHPADWVNLGKRAGYVRNAQMVALGAELCLAFNFNSSRGTTMCTKLAEDAGIPVEVKCR